MVILYRMPPRSGLPVHAQEVRDRAYRDWGDFAVYKRRTDAFARNVVRVFPAARSRFRFPWTRGITAYTNTHRVTRVPTCLRASYGAIPPRSAGHASGIGSKASIGRDLCNDTRCRPRGRLSHHLVYVLCTRHAGSLSLSGIISGRDT